MKNRNLKLKLIGTLMILVLIVIAVGRTHTKTYPGKITIDNHDEIQSSSNNDTLKEIKDKLSNNSLTEKYGENIYQLDRAGTILYKHFNYLNSKDYLAAYKMLDPEYIEDFKVTVQEYAANNEFQTPKVPVIDNIEVLADRCIVDVHLVDDLGSEEEIEDISNIKKKTYSIIDKSGNIYIADKGIINSTATAISKNYSNLGLSASIDKLISCKDGLVFKLRINNISTSAYVLSKSINAVIGKDKSDYRGKFIKITPEEHNIGPTSSKSYTLEFERAKEIDAILIYFDDGNYIKID